MRLRMKMEIWQRNSAKSSAKHALKTWEIKEWRFSLWWLNVTSRKLNYTLCKLDLTETQSASPTLSKVIFSLRVG